MLTVVTWRWKRPDGSSLFGPEFVNRMRNMLERRLGLPHRLLCLTDDTQGIDPRVECLPLPTEFADTFRCRRRMWQWSRDRASLFGPRFLAIVSSHLLAGVLATPGNVCRIAVCTTTCDPDEVAAILGGLGNLFAGLGAALLLPLYYLVDATLTLLRRLMRGEAVWVAHRSHFYQQATDNGFSVIQVVREVFVLNIVLAALAAFTIWMKSPAVQGIMLLLGTGAVAIVLYRFSHQRKIAS